MHNYCLRASVALSFFVSLIRPGRAFLFAGSRVTFPANRHQHDLHASPSSEAAAGNSWLAPRRQRSTVGAVRVVPSEASADQQLPGLPAIASVEEGDISNEQPDEDERDAAQSPPPTKDTPWRGTAVDGTALAFRKPTTEDLHKLKMGDWVARRGLAVALVALDGAGQDAEAAGEAIIGAPLAGAVVKAMDGVGGSSVATRVCLLRHRREEDVSEAVEHALLDETINQFLNDGARISQLRVEVEDSAASIGFYSRHGFIPSTEAAPEGCVLLEGDRVAALEAVQASLGGGESQGAVGAVAMNLLARLLHDAGDLPGAANAYLKALEIDPTRSEVFRGLGGAYQSQGQHQMAFASYQQAINLAPWDLLAYLKLGMLYEELAVGKYEEAGDHAIRCFEYYLQHSGSEDTDVLTRLGNLQVLRLDPESAVKTYERALAVDPSLSNVWFNLANAYLKLGQESEAARCLNEKLRLDPDTDAGVSAKYLLASLESDPGRLTVNDQVAYARELFDYYAPKYDDHMRKKLLYTGPRLLRKNMKEVYNATFQSFPEDIRASHNGDVLSYLNGSLAILDLGCGTGLIGSWFKDYASKLVGVDVSPTMLDMATKKGCYHELRRGDVRTYLAASEEEQFELVVAAETLQYLGPLDTIVPDTFKVLKPGGFFAFTSTNPRDTRFAFPRRCTHFHNDTHDDPEAILEGYSLKADGTYAYRRAYLEQLARRSGYEIVTLKRHSTMVQRGEAAPGYMGVFRKPI
ncbi:unnamed protein product [Scytosiphon promiscuus]